MLALGELSRDPGVLLREGKQHAVPEPLTLLREAVVLAVQQNLHSSPSWNGVVSWILTLSGFSWLGECRSEPSIWASSPRPEIWERDGRPFPMHRQSPDFRRTFRSGTA